MKLNATLPSDFANCTMSFHLDNGIEVGSLTWTYGTVKFNGNLDESAKALFELVRENMIEETKLHLYYCNNCGHRFGEGRNET